jgi:hypothetical protein
VVDRARVCTSQLKKICYDGGFKKICISSCGEKDISVDVVHTIHDHRFDMLPRRWIVERT